MLVRGPFHIRKINFLKFRNETELLVKFKDENNTLAQIYRTKGNHILVEIPRFVNM